MLQHLTIVTTGGTIDKIYFDDKSNYQIGAPQIGEILNQLGVAFTFDVIARWGFPPAELFSMGKLAPGISLYRPWKLFPSEEIDGSDWTMSAFRSLCTSERSVCRRGVSPVTTTFCAAVAIFS